jgi:hypothetical protein
MISIQVDGIEYRFYDHLYAVSSCGKVLRKLLAHTPAKHNQGYLTLGSRRLMHRVVAKCWLESFDPNKHVHHINGIKSDNRAENLECLTAAEHIGERHKGINGHYVRTNEAREKIRQARLGKVTSEETKTKQRAALLGRKRPYFNRAGHSEASKAKKSLEHHRNTRCVVFGVEYRSFAKAAEATGIHRFTLRKRCLSENFPDYEIVSGCVALPTF